MTRLRSSMVCEPALAFCARELSLGDFILLGKGEEATGGRKRDSIISDVMEAVIGAVYLDGGIGEAEKFIHRYILSDLENKQLFYDSKTLLQEKMQKQGRTITYELVSEAGPDHDKVFTVEVVIDGQTVARGEGRNKKSAQQQAAYQVLLAEMSEK
ncbi:ribonuclease 3 [Lachnospiraceae bacterium]|nr:ribonuclease 3 [Lachnospiraceae bacterium]